jgi:thiol:disulfide interchange protein DsbC
VRFLTALLLSALATGAQADEAEIRRALGARLQAGAIESVRPSPVAGIFEVVVRGDSGVQIFYTDGAARYVFVGNLVDAQGNRDLTQDRTRELSAVKWESLPLEWSFVVRHGNGKRRIAVFSDPNCPYCRRFEGDLQKLGDVTIHLFLYPVIKQDSVRQVKAVWCSRDRARAWMDLMFRGVDPGNATDCDTPVERILALGRKVGARGTPTWILPNGEVHSGALPIEQVKTLLEAGNAGATRPRN